jgi:hypothetical protein
MWVILSKVSITACSDFEYRSVISKIEHPKSNVFFGSSQILVIK